MVWIRGKIGSRLCVADGSAKSEFPGRRKRDAGRFLSMPRTGPPAWALTKRSDARISGASRPPEEPEKRSDTFFAPGTASRRGWQSGKRGFGERREHWSGCCLSGGAHACSWKCWGMAKREILRHPRRDRFGKRSAQLVLQTGERAVHGPFHQLGIETGVFADPGIEPVRDGIRAAEAVGPEGLSRFPI